MPARKEALARQLQEAGAADDEEVMRQAQELLDIVAEENPQTLWATEDPDPPPQHT